MLVTVLVLSWLFLTTEATVNACSCSGAELVVPNYTERPQVMLVAVLELSWLLTTTPKVPR